MELTGFSIAGMETCIEVPSLRLVLDLGRCSRTAVNQGLVLVSHGHLDHAGALAHHASRRAMMKMDPPTYLVPKAIAADVERLFNAAGDLDGHAIPRQVVPLEPGQEFALSAKRWVRPFPTVHRVPSQGYTIWERRQILRAEFQGRAGAELAELRARGVELSVARDVALLSFTGDTRIEALETNDELRAVETLIMEATFLDDRISVADARAMGHTHLDEILDRGALLPPTNVVLCHFSARYEPADVAAILNARLPASLRATVRAL